MHSEERRFLFALAREFRRRLVTSSNHCRTWGTLRWSTAVVRTCWNVGRIWIPGRGGRVCADRPRVAGAAEDATQPVRPQFGVHWSFRCYRLILMSPASLVNAEGSRTSISWNGVGAVPPADQSSGTRDVRHLSVHYLFCTCGTRTLIMSSTSGAIGVRVARQRCQPDGLGGQNDEENLQTEWRGRVVVLVCRPRFARCGSPTRRRAEQFTQHYRTHRVCV